MKTKLCEEQHKKVRQIVSFLPLLGQNSSRDTRLVLLTGTSLMWRHCLGQLLSRFELFLAGRCPGIKRSWLCSGIRAPRDKALG